MAAVAAYLEKKGIPVVTQVVDIEKIKQIAVKSYQNSGVPEIRTIYVPREKWIDKVPDETVSQFLEALTKPRTAEEKKSGRYKPPVPPRIAFEGAYDEIQEFFTGDLSAYIESGPFAKWTDGLPIAPPTEEAVARMLTGTSHKPDEIVHPKMGPENRIVTVEKVAINAVMAGAKPEHLPVLLAITESGLKNPWGSSGSMGILNIVSGPIVEEISMSSGTALMTPGNPANMAISRYTTLAVRNLEGIQPGTGNISAYGTPFMGFTLAESPDSPWEGLNERMGFSTKESVVLQLNYKVAILGHGTAEATIASDKPTVPEMLIATSKAFQPAADNTGRIIIVNPTVAGKWKKEYGWNTMAELQDFLWDNVKWPRKNYDVSYWWGTRKPFKDWVESMGHPRGSRMLNPDHVDLPPDALVPINISPKDYIILVAGGGAPDYNMYQPSFAWGTFGTCTPLSIDKWR